MNPSFAAPKGTYDVLPADSARWLEVRRGLLEPARLAGYSYIETPVFEDTGLFERGVGESTDVVTKEMYTFRDKGERSLTLRPEATASIVRAVTEHRLGQGQLPLKVWFAGPMFRYEQPQSGRFRQFQQIDVEALGIDDPALDAEVVALGAHAFRGIGLQRVELLMTSLGDPQCRPAYTEKLRGFLRNLPLPDEDTRRRAERNPLRVLDDKRPEVIAMVADAPLMAEALCADCQAHYDSVRGYLADIGVSWTEAPRLVRGLDYYQRTTFEWTHSGLGAQSAVGGGGRYDGLSESVGGPPLPGIGWALGMERILLALGAEEAPHKPAPRVGVFIVALGPEAKRFGVKLVNTLRAERVAADLAYGDRKLGGAMKAADRSGAHTAVVIGDRDLAAEVAQVKDLASGEQRAVPLKKLIEELVR